MASMVRISKSNPAVVEITNEADMHFWCNRLRVSRGLLAETIRYAGPRISDIESYLIGRDA